MKAMACQTCEWLHVKAGSEETDFPLVTTSTGYHWYYMTRNFDKGRIDVEIYSPGETNLDKMLVYSDGTGNATIENVFPTSYQVVSKIDYNKVEPTKYTAKIEATKPFMLVLNEQYNGLWSAFVNGKEYESINIYPDKSGFYITETGSFDVVIEYKPQRWFEYGAVITIISIAISIGYIGWKERSYLSKTALVLKFLTRKKMAGLR
jgi:hypothetical protein